MYVVESSLVVVGVRTSSRKFYRNDENGIWTHVPDDQISWNRAAALHSIFRSFQGWEIITTYLIKGVLNGDVAVPLDLEVPLKSW